MGHKMLSAGLMSVYAVMKTCEGIVGLAERYVPKKHIPDMRIYDTDVFRYAYYTVYRHRLHYGYGSFFHNGGVVRYMNMQDVPERFVNEYLNSCTAFEMKHKPYKKTVVGDGLTLVEYNINDAINEYYSRPGWRIGRNDDFGILHVLLDGVRVVWLSGRSRLVSAERNENGYYIITDRGAGFVAEEKGRYVCDYYLKGSDMHPGSKIAAARMLDGNTARIEYKSGGVAHWRIRLSKRDCVRNIRANAGEKCGDYHKASASIVWHNDRLTGSKLLYAWDMNPDTSVEPEYK
ncbi:MAG: hypothetical protein IK083_05325 [Abditibacteriota bacterium]|nr:hypothetical protein [Abditibacteriota bacterium]